MTGPTWSRASERVGREIAGRRGAVIDTAPFDASRNSEDARTAPRPPRTRPLPPCRTGKPDLLSCRRYNPADPHLQRKGNTMHRRLFDLSGRVALVTGGSKGLGKAMARGLAEAGAHVVISSRHEDELQGRRPRDRRGARGPGQDLVADLSRRAEATPARRRGPEAMGKVDILINNAGTNKPQPIDQIEDEVWDQLVELNLGSCMALTRALAPGMKERKWGRVIHISSIMGFSSAAGRDVYSATKSALLGLARAGANDLGGFGITVNCIAPGPLPHRPPLQPPVEGAAGRIRPPHRPGPMGPARRADRPRPAPRQRRGQLHHRDLPHRRRRMPRQDLLRGLEENNSGFHI